MTPPNVANLFSTKQAEYQHLLVGDSGAGCSIIFNKKLLTNIRQAPNNGSMRLYCNSGMTTTTKIGDMAGYGSVWYNPNGIANILSLGEAKSRGYRITMDTSIDDAIFIHKKDGTHRRFGVMASGIYCCDLKQQQSSAVHVSVTEQAQQYSATDVDRAKKARKLQEVMGFISERDLLQVIDNNLIRDSKVRRRDVITAQDIYGPNTNILKGKATRATPAQVREDDYIDVPRSIMDRYSKNVTLFADVMHVNGQPYFIAISKHIKHISVIPTANMKKTTMLKSIDRVIKAYYGRGFIVTRMHMDNAFEPLIDDMHERKVTLNNCSSK